MQFAPLSQLFGFRRLIKRNVPCLENSRQIASWRPAIAIPSVDPAISTEKPVVERGARVRGRIRLRFALMIVLIANGSVAFAEGDAAGPGQQADQQAERKAICSKRLRQFIIEIDRQMETSRSSDLLQWTISRHFPLFGCDLDEAFAIVRQSKYFERVFRSGADRHGSLVFFLRKPIPNGWGFEVSFGLQLNTGDSELPAAGVDKIKH